MKYSDIVKKLYEAVDIDKTVANFGDKLNARVVSDHSWPEKDRPEVMVGDFINHDPTNNQQYVLWMIRTYLRGGIKFMEDLSRVKAALGLFHKFKQKLDIKDIGQVKSLKQLEDLVEKVKDEKTGGEESKEQKQKIYDESEVIYKGSEGMIVVPKTEKASCYWGKGTKWCTAATHSQNMFGRYNERGNLYILMYPDGVKYQFHLATEQFMDEQDDDINFDEFMDSDRFDLYKHIKFSEQEQLSAIRKGTRDTIKFFVNPSEKVKFEAVNKSGYAIKWIKNPSEEIQMAAVKQNGQSIVWIVNPSEDVQMAAVKNNGMALADIKNPSDEIIEAAIYQNPQSIFAVKNPSKELKELAVRQYPPSIRYVRDQDDETCIKALKYAEEEIEAGQKRNILANTFAGIKDPSKEVYQLYYEIKDKLGLGL